MTKKTLLSSDKRLSILSKLAIQNPNPSTELVYNTPFELLCAVVLSAQATDISVNKVTPTLFTRAPNALAMSQLSEEEIASYIKSIGLWRAKAHNLKALSTILHNKFAGEVPDNFEDLITLPGVGSKTANVVLNVAFNQPTIAVDTHIFRVCNRTGFCIGKDAKTVEKLLPQLVDDRYKLKAHHQILLHGRYICKAQKPLCEQCVIKEECVSYKKLAV